MPDPESRILVVAALIQDDQHYLITERPNGTALEGFWEFPGGKLHPNEEPRAGLQREIAEELGITVDVGDTIEVVQHTYPDKIVMILFFACRIVHGKPVGKEGQRFRWATPDEMVEIRFLPADLPVIKKLINLATTGLKPKGKIEFAGA